MKKILALIILLQLTAPLCRAQITLQPLIPQTGLFEKNQLWNILAANASTSSTYCYLVLSLQDRESGLEVLSATTSEFILNKGAKQLNTATLTPIQYNYVSDQANDFLPVGSYTACYKLMTGHGGLLAEACVPFDVAPLSPPMLISPADSSVLPITPAQFTWQPPAPLTMFQQLHYQIVIAEIYPGQRPEEAIELNAPFYIDMNVPSSFMNYTGAYPSFEKGKWYAWQVVAQDGENYADKTPVWDFSISAQNVPEVRPANGDYILLKSRKESSAGVNTITGGILGIKYYSFEKDHQTSLQFVGPDGKIVEEVSEKITYGDNFIGYKLDHTFKKGTVYSVGITDSKNNRSVAFFVIK
jgi:hypothetical protein